MRMVVLSSQATERGSVRASALGTWVRAPVETSTMKTGPWLWPSPQPTPPTTATWVASGERTGGPKADSPQRTEPSLCEIWRGVAPAMLAQTCGLPLESCCTQAMVCAGSEVAVGWGAVAVAPPVVEALELQPARTSRAVREMTAMRWRCARGEVV